MKHDEHFEERGNGLNMMGNLKITNVKPIVRTEKTISRLSTRIDGWRKQNLAKAPPGYSLYLEGPRGHPPEGGRGSPFQLIFTVSRYEKGLINNKKIQFKFLLTI